MDDNKQNNVPMSAATTPPIQRSEIRKDVGFVSRYANNVQLESNAFDIRLLFGIMDQSGATKVPPELTPAIDQHTSINLSWPEVKILIFYMQLHLAAHESENGKVKIPASALPPEIPPKAPAPFDNPQGERVFETMRRVRAEFMAKLSEP
jgi:hypothetical protein